MSGECAEENEAPQKKICAEVNGLPSASRMVAPKSPASGAKSQVSPGAGICVACCASQRRAPERGSATRSGVTGSGAPMTLGSRFLARRNTSGLPHCQRTASSRTGRLRNGSGARPRQRKGSATAADVVCASGKVPLRQRVSSVRVERFRCGSGCRPCERKGSAAAAGVVRVSGKALLWRRRGTVRWNE